METETSLPSPMSIPSHFLLTSPWVWTLYKAREEKYSRLGLNLDIPLFGGLVHWESSTLDYAATEVSHMPVIEAEIHRALSHFPGLSREPCVFAMVTALALMTALGREALDLLKVLGRDKSRQAFHLASKCFVPFHVGLAFPRDAPYSGVMSHVVVRALQSGLVRKLKREVEWELRRSSTGTLLQRNRVTCWLLLPNRKPAFTTPVSRTLLVGFDSVDKGSKRQGDGPRKSSPPPISSRRLTLNWRRSIPFHPYCDMKNEQMTWWSRVNSAMERYGRLSEADKGRILGLVEAGYTDSEISRAIPCSRKSVSLWKSRWENENSLKCRHGGGALRKTTREQDAALVSVSQASPYLTSRQIAARVGVNLSKDTNLERLREGGLQSFTAASKQILTERQKLARMNFAQENLERPLEFWRIAITDEKVWSSSNDGRVLVYRPKYTRFQPPYVHHRRYSGRFSVSSWGFRQHPGFTTWIIIRRQYLGFTAWITICRHYHGQTTCITVSCWGILFLMNAACRQLTMEQDRINEKRMVNLGCEAERRITFDMFRQLGYRLEDMSDIKISNGSLEYYIAEVDKGYSERCDSSIHWLGRHNPRMWEASQSIESCSTSCPVYKLKEGDEAEILQEENALCAVLDRIEREEYDRVKCLSELEKYRPYNVRRLEGDEEVSEEENEPNIISLDCVGRVRLPDHFITMSPKVLEPAPRLRAMYRMNPQQRVALLKTADKKLVDSVCECAYNTLKGRVPLKNAQKTKLRAQAGFAQADQTRRVLEEEETTTRSEGRSVLDLTLSPFNQRCPRFLIQQVNNGTHEKDDIGVPGNITPLRATPPTSGIGNKSSSLRVGQGNGKKSSLQNLTTSLIGLYNKTCYSAICTLVNTTTEVPVLPIPALLNTISAQARKKAELLLEHIISRGGISWDSNGEVSIQDTPLRGSNIVDLVNDLVRARRHSEPSGWREFLTALQKINVPKEFIVNPKRLAPIRNPTPVPQPLTPSQRPKKKKMKREDENRWLPFRA
uniref:Transposase Tc1-like domain-containing protein n=1 Tax=Timema monikensis TaxID=170555 RepID=A0A7R9EGL5_9NEOP|nr:unnamed protein product [Timema monikensis]